MYATHCDGLVLGFGRTVARSEADAIAHGAEIDGCGTCRITLEASVHVFGGGDCRALRWTRNESDPSQDVFSLRDEPL